MEGKMQNAGNKLVIEMAPWTNGDAIRDMTDEELALEMASKGGCPHDCEEPENIDTDCVKCWIDWLRQEAQDAGDGP